MNPAALLESLQSKGIRLSTKGDRLVIDAPAGFLTPAVKVEIAAFKEELLKLLAQEPKGTERLEQGPYRGFYVATDVHHPDPVLARQALDEAELWRQKRAAWLRKLLLPNLAGGR